VVKLFTFSGTVSRSVGDISKVRQYKNGFVLCYDQKDEAYQKTTSKNAGNQYS